MGAHTHTHKYKCICTFFYCYIALLMYFKILETIQAPPYIAYQNGRGKEEQHDKAKAMHENVVSGILFHLYRSVPDFGKMC